MHECASDYLFGVEEDVGHILGLPKYLDTFELTCLAEGLPLRWCVRAGASCCESRYDNEKGQGAEKTKGFQKGPLSCRQEK